MPITTHPELARGWVDIPLQAPVMQPAIIEVSPCTGRTTRTCEGRKVVSIRTLLTEKFGLEYPIVSAPMGSVAGGRLAASVSNAGALGLVGGGYGDPDWLRAE